MGDCQCQFMAVYSSRSGIGSIYAVERGRSIVLPDICVPEICVPDRSLTGLDIAIRMAVPIIELLKHPDGALPGRFLPACMLGFTYMRCRDID